MSNVSLQHIGLFGFGTVGKGLYDVLKVTPGLKTSIKKVCIKNPDKKRAVTDISFTTDPASLLDDAEITVIVELIDDAEAAYAIVKGALQRGKAVVTANKKMIAAHFEELYQLQKKHNTALLYEAACCAGIPIIRNLEEYYDNDMLHSVRGIVNGSTNYILSAMERGASFTESLMEAQQLGFAESNPSLDIEGHDALNKLVILIAHSFGTVVKPSSLLFSGITAIHVNDAAFAREKNLRIKLVAHAQKLAGGELAAFVLPSFVAKEDDLYHVPDEFNGLVTESSFADTHFFKGKGAGAFPTAAAVLSDLAALAYQYKYEYKKLGQEDHAKPGNNFYLKIFVSASSIQHIRQEEFEWIEEWHNEYNYTWVIGVVDVRKLINPWWKQPGISLICCPQPIIESVSYRSVRKKSLELAGVLV